MNIVAAKYIRTFVFAIAASPAVFSCHLFKRSSDDDVESKVSPTSKTSPLPTPGSSSAGSTTKTPFKSSRNYNAELLEIIRLDDSYKLNEFVKSGAMKEFLDSSSLQDKTQILASAVHEQKYVAKDLINLGFMTKAQVTFKSDTPKDNLEYLITRASEHRYSYSAGTNSYYLENLIPHIEKNLASSGYSREEFFKILWSKRDSLGSTVYSFAIEKGMSFEGAATKSELYTYFLTEKTNYLVSTNQGKPTPFVEKICNLEIVFDDQYAAKIENSVSTAETNYLYNFREYVVKPCIMQELARESILFHNPKRPHIYVDAGEGRKTLRGFSFFTLVFASQNNALQKFVNEEIIDKRVALKLSPRAIFQLALVTGRTDLFNEVKKTAAVKEMLTKNLSSESMSPFLYAVSFGHYYMVKEIINLSNSDQFFPKKDMVFSAFQMPGKSLNKFDLDAFDLALLEGTAQYPKFETYVTAKEDGSDVSRNRYSETIQFLIQDKDFLDMMLANYGDTDGNKAEQFSSLSDRILSQSFYRYMNAFKGILDDHSPNGIDRSKVFATILSSRIDLQKDLDESLKKYVLVSLRDFLQQLAGSTLTSKSVIRTRVICNIMILDYEKNEKYAVSPVSKEIVSSASSNEILDAMEQILNRVKNKPQIYSEKLGDYVKEFARHISDSDQKLSDDQRKMFLKIAKN